MTLIFYKASFWKLKLLKAFVLGKVSSGFVNTHFGTRRITPFPPPPPPPLFLPSSPSVHPSCGITHLTTLQCFTEVS